MTTIALICAVTWFVIGAFVYLVEDNLRLASTVGLLSAVWVAVILMFIGMAGR